jgi:hypothetical protein
MDILFFETPADLRAWFEANHTTVQEMWVGYHKTGTGKPSVTYPESVDEALCFGWIDGVRQRIDDVSYTNRFTPRQKRSTWSNVNIKRVEALIAQGRMHPAGLAAYEARGAERTGVYTYEQPVHELEASIPPRCRPPGRRGLLPAPIGLVSPPGDPVGDERQTTGDAPAPPGDPDRGFGGGAHRRAAGAPEVSDQLSAVSQRQRQSGVVGQTGRYILSHPLFA